MHINLTGAIDLLRNVPSSLAVAKRIKQIEPLLVSAFAEAGYRFKEKGSSPHDTWSYLFANRVASGVPLELVVSLLGEKALEEIPT